MYGWNNVVELKLTDETISYNTYGLTIAQFFKQHFDAIKFGDWLSKKMEERLDFTKKLAQKIEKLIEAEEKLEESKNLNSTVKNVNQLLLMLELQHQK